MKKIFQKNQLIITALALMIAVAGYFSYMNNHIDDGTAAETAANAGTDALNAEYEISDEDPLAAEDIFTDEGTGPKTARHTGRTHFEINRNIRCQPRKSAKRHRRTAPSFRRTRDSNH